MRTTQDEELAVTKRSAGLPSPEKVTELLGGEFARSGYEIEDVEVNAKTVPPRIIVVADGDNPLDLDTIAELSRSASELLDSLDIGDDGDQGYVLEVTSPGVDRPLTEERHFRRARCRLVNVELAEGGTLTGRLGTLSDGIVELVVRDRNDWTTRRLSLAEIRQAVVQVEFSPPSPRELQLVEGHRHNRADHRDAGTEAGT